VFLPDLRYHQRRWRTDAEEYEGQAADGEGVRCCGGNVLGYGRMRLRRGLQRRRRIKSVIPFCS